MSFIQWDVVVKRYTQAARVNRGAEELRDSFIDPAEAELNGRLSGYFTVPFSGTNLTAVDLAIDLTFARMGVMKAKDLTTFITGIDTRIERIKLGKQAMMVSSSNNTVNPVVASDKEGAWSDTKEFHPTFGHGSVEEFIVSSAQVRDERNARGEFV